MAITISAKNFKEFISWCQNSNTNAKDQKWTKLTLAPWKKSYDQTRQHIKKQRHYFTNKGPSSQSYGFSSSHVWMWELGHKEGWTSKIWHFWIVVLEKTLFFFFQLYNIVLVLPYINMNPPQEYTCSPSWTPLLVPSFSVVSVIPDTWGWYTGEDSWEALGLQGDPTSPS